MSPQKKITSAMRLPKCKATSKASVESALRSPENTTRCPELLTGRNSVSPCTIPSTMLFHKTISGTSRYDLKHMPYGRQTHQKKQRKGCQRTAEFFCGAVSVAWLQIREASVCPCLLYTHLRAHETRHDLVCRLL